MACQGCTPIIGIWSCPIENMSRWKGYGINTLINRELQGGRYTQAQWRQAAKDRGLNYIDSPSASLAADHADPNLIAFLMADEPDGHNYPVSIYSDQYAAIRAVSNKPCYGSFNGQKVTFAQTAVPPYNGRYQTPFLPYADWIGNAWYPKNNNATRYPLSLIGDAMRLLAQWSNGKPQLPWVECSDQNIQALGRSPTTEEMKSIVRLIMARTEAIGYAFFPFTLSGDVGRGYKPFSFDTTTPEMRLAITEINAEMMPKASVPTVVYELLSDHTWRVPVS